MAQLGTAARTALSVARVPLWIAGVVGADKSFKRNPIIGSPALNRMGLHTARIKAAAAMAERRRAKLGAALDPADRAAFDRDGIVIKENFLSDEEFAALKAEVYGKSFPSRELRQGQAVQRMVPLGSKILAANPNIDALVHNPTVRALTYYSSSRRGQPVYYLQTVLSQPDGPNDPQTALHADTFHSTTKGWFFLHDVVLEEGPFVYVPGSHKITPARLEWEHEKSVTAKGSPDGHHAAGSFRITPDEIARMGYRPPQPVPVKANTLVVADTFGFHARARSERASTRVTFHTYIRRNPFLPWTGLDLKALPGLKGRELDIYLTFQDWSRKITGSGAPWRPVGAVKVDSPAHV